ncbi:hypothetical protein HDU67_005324 [Dinochytrium kinnereticum]|nr:hypothetical protein HDU67_005324 [Dinochytrium kinnereticum]
MTFAISLVRDDGTEWHLDSKTGEEDLDGYRKLIIGRKTPGIDDKRVSREHLRVRYSLSSGKVYIALLGQNPSFIERLELIAMSKNHEYSLSNGDAFWLMNNSTKFTVKMKFKPVDSGDETDAEEAQMEKKSVMRDDRSKPAKSDRGDDKRKTPCQYGSKCYRKNAEHLARFSHPEAEASVVPAKRTVESGGGGGEEKRGKVESRSLSLVKDEGKPGSSAVSSPTRSQHEQDSMMDIDAFENPNKLEDSAKEASVEDDDLSPLFSQDILPNSPSMDVVEESTESASHSAPKIPPRISFPSIATREGGMDVVKAASVACEVIKDFLSKCDHPEMELVLVDGDEEVLEAFQGNISDSRFKTLCSNSVSRLKTEHNIESSTVVVETNWRLKPEATSFSRDLHNRAGPMLLEELKNSVKKPPKVASVCPVKIPSELNLLTEEGIQHIIYVVGPNMNRMRPDPIVDEAKALGSLRECYQAVFQTFSELVGIGTPLEPSKPKTAFDKLMSSRKAMSTPEPEPVKRSAYSWDQALLKYVDHPEKYPSQVGKYDDKFVTIRDVYPKAAQHFLVMPRIKIGGIADLRKHHLPLLTGMKERADEIVEGHTNHRFLIGFHAIPSMKQLHLHVISDDFVAPALKTKTHWNSFTTRFFLPYALVRKTIEEDGQLSVMTTIARD